MRALRHGSQDDAPKQAPPKRKANSKKETSRGWPGYEPTPGKKPGPKGACKPKK
jgi:hypothetical protein